MTRGRLVVAGLMVALLGMLLVWQRHREAMMAQCLASGGFWNGPRSTCMPAPFGPILKRSIDRT